MTSAPCLVTATIAGGVAAALADPDADADADAGTVTVGDAAGLLPPPQADSASAATTAPEARAAQRTAEKV
ncbi:MAG: hypothetical protein WAL16_21495 [Streptosporangiaceae bacterium]